MKSAFSTCMLSIACIAATAATSLAEKLDPSKIPQNAKWVMHIDHDALGETKLMELIRDQHADKITEIRSWMDSKLGIDPQQDLHNVTLFGETYEHHQGAGIMCAKYDRKKVEEQFSAKVGVQKTESEDYTFYTWDVEQNMQHQHAQVKPNAKLPANRGVVTTTDTPANSAGDNTAKPGRGQGSYGDTMVTAVLADDTTIVFAPTLERAKAVAKLVKGGGESLKGKDSKLVAQIPADAFFYGSAVELDKISRNEGLFPVLRQHSFVSWAIGERDGKVFEELTLVGKNEEVAEQMKSGLEGLAALVNVWAADSEAINKLQKSKAIIEREGDTVRATWEGDAADVAAAIDEVKSRVERRMQEQKQ